MILSTNTLAPVEFDPPLVNPSGTGLYPATSWTDEAAGTATRWLAEGIQFRTHNFGGEAAFGVWLADWCAQPDDLTVDDLKTGTRPGDPNAFLAATVWAYDACDPTPASQAEIRERVQQNLRLVEQTAIEREFAARLLIDVGAAPSASADLPAAVGTLEAEFAKTNTVGLIHASAELVAPLSRDNLVIRSGTGLRSPLGHLWVFGGGYVEGLGKTLVATSPTYGWRDQVALRESYGPNDEGEWAAVAERSVVVGYEKLIGSAAAP